MHMRLGMILLWTVVFAWQSGSSATTSATLTGDTFLQEIASCFAREDAERLAKHFNERVEIAIEGNSRDYARSQAKFVIRDFLQKHPVNTFDLEHRGNTANAMYALGAYRSANGAYEVDIYIKMLAGAYVIDQIKFQRLH